MQSKLLNIIHTYIFKLHIKLLIVAPHCCYFTLIENNVLHIRNRSQINVANVKFCHADRELLQLSAGRCRKLKSAGARLKHEREFCSTSRRAVI